MDGGETIPHVELAEAHEEWVPVCLECLTPVHPLQHLCHRCGQTVGQLTPYDPFLGIRFNYGPFSVIWRRTWYSRRSRVERCFYFLVILNFAPIMLLIGVPIVLWRKARRFCRRVRQVNRQIAARGSPSAGGG